MIDKSRLVHVAFIAPDGRRSWFVRTDRRLDPSTGQSTTWPLVDTEPRNSQTITYEFGEVSKRLWSSPPFSLNVRLTLEAGPNTEFIDEGNGSSPSVPAGAWEFKDYLVTCHETGEPLDSFDAPCVLRIRAVLTPEGKKFCLRADNPSLTSPSVFETFERGPEAVVEKAWSLGFRGYSTITNPMIERRKVEDEIKKQQAANAHLVNIRPGDRL